MDITPSPKSTQYWIQGQNGKLVQSESLHIVIEASMPGPYALCDYSTDVNGFDRHYGNVWCIKNNIIELLSSFTKVSTSNLNDLEAVLQREYNFTFWRIFQVSKEFEQYFLLSKKHCLGLPGYTFINGCVFFDK